MVSAAWIWLGLPPQRSEPRTAVNARSHRFRPRDNGTGGGGSRPYTDFR